jgi:hypothetical protein
LNSKRMGAPTIAALLVSGVLVVSMGVTPATASEANQIAPGMTTRDLNTNVKPGRFGRLKLPVKITKARKKGYVFRNKMCGRWEVRGTAFTIIKKRRVVALEVTGSSTTKGLVAGDSAAKMRALYPKTKRNGRERTQSGIVAYKIYSVKTRAGWLDNYVPINEGWGGYLGVRAKSVKRPIYMSGEGC